MEGDKITEHGYQDEEENVQIMSVDEFIEKMKEGEKD